MHLHDTYECFVFFSVFSVWHAKDDACMHEGMQEWVICIKHICYHSSRISVMFNSPSSGLVDFPVGEGSKESQLLSSSKDALESGPIAPVESRLQPGAGARGCTVGAVDL